MLIYTKSIFRRLTSSFILSFILTISFLFCFYTIKRGGDLINKEFLFYFYQIFNNNIVLIFSISIIISIQITIFSLKNRNELLALTTLGYKKSTLSRPFFSFAALLSGLLFLSLFFVSRPIGSRQELSVNILSHKIEERMELEVANDGSRVLFFFDEGVFRDLFWFKTDGEIWYVNTFNTKNPGRYLGTSFEKYKINQKNQLELFESGESIEFPEEVFKHRSGLHRHIHSMSTYELLKIFFWKKDLLSLFNKQSLLTTIYYRCSTSMIPLMIVLFLLPGLFKISQTTELIRNIAVGASIGACIIWYTELSTLLGVSCLVDPLYSLILLPLSLSLFMFYRFSKV